MKAMNRWACGFWIGASLFLALLAPGAEGDLAYASPSTSPEVSRQAEPQVVRDVVYGTNDGVLLKLDIWTPTTVVSNAVPVVVRIHGGGWSAGDKSNAGCVPVNQELLKRGYATVSIDYRLAPQHKFPAQIQDAKCAIRFLRAHAAEYNLDPERIGVLGESAGGHLAALLGLAEVNASWDGRGGWTNESSRVGAVADLFGPMDLVSAAKSGDPHIGAAVFGVTNVDDPRLMVASPVTYVSKNAPPFLIVQGDRDRLVLLGQSEDLQNRLTAAGANSTLMVVKNADHGFAPSGGKTIPGRSEIARVIADFFDRTLRK